MHKRLYSFLQKNSVLYQYQFGFRKNYSTSIALIEVVDSIIKYLDDSDTVVEFIWTYRKHLIQLITKFY